MKIGFDMGHTLVGKGTGAVGIVKETDVNRAVGNLVMKYLKQLGETVVNCTVDKSENDLADRVRISNSNNVDLYVSLHVNAGGGIGTETYVYKKGGKAETFAKKVNDSLVGLGFRNRGVKEASFYVIRETIAPAILIELFFGDTQSDCDLYQRLGADKIARAIAEAITGKKITDAPATDDNNSGKTKFYRVIAGSYTIRENADDMVELLKTKGIPAFIEVFYKENGSETTKFYRVIAGSYTVRQNADDMVELLKSKGIPAFIEVFYK